MCTTANRGSRNVRHIMRVTKETKCVSLQTWIASMLWRVEGQTYNEFGRDGCSQSIGNLVRILAETAVASSNISKSIAQAILSTMATSIGV